jgi:hypothetical protein|tara:strand:+ start:2018 stop:2230 length:213 start_codon:yes stop_codon:yes gene_type:complete
MYDYVTSNSNQYAKNCLCNRISAAQLLHGKYSKTKLAKAKHRADIGRRFAAKLRRIEQKLRAAGLMPTDD